MNFFTGKFNRQVCIQDMQKMHDKIRAKKRLYQRIEPEELEENSNKEGTTNELREEEQLGSYS